MSKISSKLLIVVICIMLVIIGFSVATIEIQYRNGIELKEKIKTLQSKEIELVEVEVQVKLETKKIITKYIIDNSNTFDELAEMIANGFIKVSKEFDLPIGLLIGTAQVESTFKSDAISNKGAKGLMQINPAVWVHGKSKTTPNLIKEGIIKSERDLYNPIKNIRAGAFIIKYYMGKAPKNDDPLKYALTKYLGGTLNGHYKNIMAKIGEYYISVKEEHVKSQRSNDVKDISGKS